MSEQYSVEAILSVVDKGFTDAMNKAGVSVDNLTQNTGKGSKGILSMATSFGVGQLAANAVMGTFNALKGAIGTVTGEMNDNAKAWAMFEGNMVMIGKSEAEIAKVKSSLQDFATQTIYSASDMAQTYSQMAAIGVENTEALVKGMGGLAASAENPAQAMKSLSTQMVQALSQPEMKWQDFRIMLEQAPAAMAQVAEHMGMSLNELTQGIQDGEVASKDFAKAVSEVGTNDNYQSMATEFKTIDQAVDGLTETLANKFMPAFELLNEIGINLVENFTNWIDALDITKATNNLRKLALRLGLVEGDLDDLADVANLTREEVEGIASSWDDMSLEEKQATVETMGQEDLAELMELLGVDFDDIPDEYTKKAYLNAYGKDALEELLWVTGTWHDLTLEEKWAVLKQQIENDKIEEVIEQRGLWNEEGFISQLADINMNDTDALQQVTDLINKWGEAEGLEPIELPEIDASNIEGIDLDWERLFASIVADANMSIARYEWSEVGNSIGSALATALNFIGSSGEIQSSGWRGSFEYQFSKMLSGISDGLVEMIESILATAAAEVDWSVFWSNLAPLQIGDSTVNWVNLFGNLKEGFSSWDNLLFGIDNAKPILEYNPEVKVNPSVEIDESDGTIEQKIEEELGRGGGGSSGDGGRFQTEMPAEIKIQPGLELDESTDFFSNILNDISEVFKTKTVSAQVSVIPSISGASSQTGSPTGGGTGLTDIQLPSLDFSGMIAETNAGLQAIQAIFDTSFAQINASVDRGMASAVASMNAGTSGAQSAGYNFGMGFYSGLASMQGSINALAAQIATNAAQTIQRGLDIHSPSRVGHWLFAMLGQGLYDGLASYQKPLEGLYSDLVDIVALDPNSFGLSDSDVYGIEQSANLAMRHTFDQSNDLSRYTFDSSDILSELREVVTAVREGRIINMNDEKVGEQVSDSVDRHGGRYGDLNELIY